MSVLHYALIIFYDYAMDAHTCRVLEFDKVLEMAAAFAVTVPGRAAVRAIKPLHSSSEIRKRINIVSECRTILAEAKAFGIEHVEDLSPMFRKLKPVDAVLDPAELRSFLPLFYSALNLKIFSESPFYPGLGAVISGLVTHPHIRKAIDRAIDNEGKIRDEASPELSHIRRSLRSCEVKIRGILEGILKQKDLLPYLQDFYIAERNNRWVIPVKRDFKGKVPGVVHDISNTGETVYVEPYSIQHVSNDLESFRAEEKLEEYRILLSLSALVREHLHEIQEDYRIVAEVDALQAVAGFSIQMNMSHPDINDNGYLQIIRGRHPLLWRTLRRERREADIVPLDAEMGKENSCMVMSGSNAGGKTVALKTIGVLSLMALSGMHVPAGSGTNIPFLGNILADIGDEQSIEQNLSTFSAHITRISEIIRQSSARTLVLIDELGTGTDPEQGGALSCAILRKLKELGTITIISTHLGMLKAFAHSEKGIVNAAMEMEEATINGMPSFRPTYKLVMGEPGTSHAFEIAESLGLQVDIIKEAKEFIKVEGSRIESLIAELRQKTAELDRRLKETDALRQEAEHLRSRLNEELSHLKAKKTETLATALREAEDIVRKTKREAQDIIDTMKKASLAEATKIPAEIDRKLEEVITIRKQHTPEQIIRLSEVTAGQRVFVHTLGKHGVVHSFNEKTRRCKVAIEGKEVEVPLHDLSEPPPSLKEIQPETKRGEQRSTHYEISDLAPELNVIGQRVDPALSLMERFLNDASMAGLKQVKIIHGIGTGILSRAIRDYLKGHPLVENYRKGTEDEGGEALTIVGL